MQKLKEKKILGTVPKKLQLVETFWDCPEFSKNKQNQKGITLIALIITIIVMLILVGVTINVALNGGLFSKAEEATTKTKIAQVKEALAIKKAEVIADNNGKTPTDYGITLEKLNLPSELKTEYENKLKISKEGILYYDASVVTSESEKNIFKSMEIEEYVETNTGELANSYTFTIGELVERGLLGTNGVVQATSEEFWPDNVSDELKNSTITKEFDGHNYMTYNITCSDPKYMNQFDIYSSNISNTYMIQTVNGLIVFYATYEAGKPITSENYADYADLTFTISMPE